MLRWVIGGVICVGARAVAAEPSTEVAGGMVVPLADTNESRDWPVGYKLAARQELPYRGKPVTLGAEWSTWDRGDPWRVHRVGVLAGRVWRSDGSHTTLSWRAAAGVELVWTSILTASWIPNANGEHEYYRFDDWEPGIPIEVAAKAALRLGPIDLGLEAAFVLTGRLGHRGWNDGPPEPLRGSTAALDLSLTIRLRE